MTPFALREQGIIENKEFDFFKKIEFIVDNIVREVKENPRKDCSPFVHALILFKFALCMMRVGGYKISDEDFNKITATITPFISQMLAGV